MIDRADICRRHGLAPRIAADLHGETADELEADAAARSAIAQMFGPPRDLAAQQGEAPPSKPIEDYSDEELREQRESIDLALQERAKREDEQQFAATLADALTVGSKLRANAELLRSIHGTAGDE